MKILLAIFLGGGAGAVARHFTLATAARLFGASFPLGTLAVNVLGCLAAGMLAEGLALKFSLPPEVRALLVTGFLGGFTTFSAFSLDVLRLTQTGQVLQAALYVALSVFLSLLAAFAGVYMIRGVWG